MAYMSQEHKKELTPAIKALLKKYNIKGTIAVRNHSKLVVTIRSGVIDFMSNANDCLSVIRQRANGYAPNDYTDYIPVNVYSIDNHFAGIACEFLNELRLAMYGARYYDNTDVQTDYFDCSHYIDISIGDWDKPYILE